MYIPSTPAAQVHNTQVVITIRPDVSLTCGVELEILIGVAALSRRIPVACCSSDGGR